MPEALTAEDIIARGDQIEAWLKMPLVVELFEKMRLRYIDEWESAKGLAKREEAFAKMQVLKDLKNEMTTIVAGKHFTRAELARRQKQG
jgi:hypothetical protein